MTSYEKYSNRISIRLSNLIKSLIAQFLNTAIMWYVITLIYGIDMLSSEGLVIQITSNAIVSGGSGLSKNFTNFNS